jgi:hypothetical protein
MTIVVTCSSKSTSELAQENTNDIAAKNAAIDRQIPALCLKVVETNLACLQNKQAVDRVGATPPISSPIVSSSRRQNRIAP